MPQTVLVTGATGYIAKHLVLQLLNDGYHVVASARRPDGEAELKKALRPHLKRPSFLDHLRVVSLDLNHDDDWQSAMHGVDAVFHTASPVPLVQPKNDQDVIRPAVDGALRAVRAARAADVTRVVITSSIAAVTGCELRKDQTAYDESNWTELDFPGLIPYYASKTLAEKAVWDWQKTSAPEMQITTICPSFVMGASLDNRSSASVHIIKRLLSGKDPAVPKMGLPCVDVSDVAQMHIRALKTPDSIGQRIIGNDQFIWFSEMAKLIKADHPNRKIPTREAPNLAVRFLALFDPTVRMVINDLGRKTELSALQARNVLGMTFRDSRQSIRDTAAFLVNNNLA